MKKKAAALRGGDETDQIEWAMPDRGAFVRWIPATFGDATVSDHELFEQQQFVRMFMSHNGPYRGIVLYHGLGSGKSCSAIAIAEALRTAVGKKVHVMLPASLRPNFVREVQLCGADMFRRRQSWASVSDASVMSRLEGAGWILPTSVRKEVVWMPSSLAGLASSDTTFIPYDELPSDSDRDSIQQQVEDAIHRFHRFWHYNGNSEKEHELASADGAFDDSVVIIDEIHNFTSNLHPDETDRGKRMIKDIYTNLMRAKRCKIVMLSGTPLVNQPVELAWIINLAHGPIETWKVPLPDGSAGLSTQNIESLSASPHVHAYWEPASKKVSDVLRFAVQLLPDGFVRAPGDDRGTFVVRSADVDGMTSEDRIRMVIKAIESDGRDHINTGTMQLDVNTLLPSDSEVFDSIFVDWDELKIRHQEVLARRCVGSISYFRGHDESLYPRLASVQLVRLSLSGRQFSEYTVVRTVERTKEEKAAKFRQFRVAKGQDVSGASNPTSMRSASRAACTFVFPDGVQRPRLGAEGIDAVDPAVRKKLYQQELASAMSRVAEMHASDGVTLLSGEGGMLRELSPKFDRIIQSLRELQGKGTAIVYSEFRNTEGVEMLALALEANGFQRLSLDASDAGVSKPVAPRFIVYDGSHPGNDALLALFNSLPDHPSVTSTIRSDIERMYPGVSVSSGNLRGELAEVLLITRSGAEGISTRNVRQVHIVEPFWHANRTEQVIGRARRAYSHDQLPFEDRTIDVFVYMAAFTPEQAVLHSGKIDKGATSDEHVFMVSERKRRLNLQLLRIMRAAAVDCEIWRREGDAEQCLADSLSVSDDDPIFHSYSLADDVASSSADARRRKQQQNAKVAAPRRRDPLTGELVP